MAARNHPHSHQLHGGFPHSCARGVVLSILPGIKERTATIPFKVISAKHPVFHYFQDERDTVDEEAMNNNHHKQGFYRKGVKFLG